MNARPDFSALPESVLKAFEGKPSLPLGETATVLGMNEKTL
jgi:hypothetical protein